ncbi:hypothetical protein B9Z55_004755 [Caenorhabditis nigoni]|uniref:Uncharacterized protein n=1 Tax=Caenorhabditis nigoni TaxID=1611254 RepID=A0A2G5UXY9_9PELO|nr:hypothetical protein B9Z55_004755 [Caenorhabditis nigoni]
MRWIVPKIGHDERLFPKNLLNDTNALHEHRTRIAQELLEKFQKFQFSNESADIEIRVVASDRGYNFLHQTVIFLREQQSLSNYHLSICNVESEIFPDLRRFEKLEIPIFTVREGSEKGKNLNSTIEKENNDYWKCLGLETKSRYILLIEDDSIVVPEFSDLLNSLISKLDFNQKIDFVKLYHPKYLRKTPSLVLTIIISIVISFFSCFAVQPVFQKFPSITFLILSIFLYFSIRSYGPQFPADVRFQLTGSAYISTFESCCTQAVIFRASSVGQMLEYFKGTIAYSGHAKDHILDESPFTGRQTDLNYVIHVGSFSSVRNRLVYLADWLDI